jgi:hypothetical protein
MRARSPPTTRWEKALDSAVSFCHAPKGMDCTMLLCKSAEDLGLSLQSCALTTSDSRHDHSLVIQAKSKWHQWAMNRLGAALIIALLPASASADLSVLSGRSHTAAGMVKTQMTLLLDLGPEPAKALVNGIPLTINLNVSLVKESAWTWHISVAKWQYPFRIQYHALSNRYTLLQPVGREFQAFTSLYEMLSSIRQVTLQEQIPAGENHTDPMSIQVRLELDKSMLPGPLKLAALFFPSWQLDSGWQQWQVTR